MSYSISSIQHSEQTYKLGEGSFGCAIKGRFIDSTNKLNYKYYTPYVGEVTKLMLDFNEFFNEIEGTIVANKIDNGESSIIINGWSILDRVDIYEILNSKETISVLKKIKDCEIIKQNLRKIDKLYQIIYSKQGITLDVMHKHLKHFNLYKILYLCRNLVDGIHKYRTHYFTHFDIKGNNIIYIPNDDKMVFIDYGLSFYYKNLNFDILYLIKYIYVLPEIIAFNIIQNYSHVSKEKAFQKFKKDYEDSLSLKDKHYYFKNVLILYLYNNSEEEYENELRVLFNSLYSKNTQELKSIILANIKYVDAYKLCFTIMELIDQYKFRNNERQHKIINMFYKKVLLPVAHINPSKRLSTQTLLYNYNVFLKFIQKVYNKTL